MKSNRIVYNHNCSSCGGKQVFLELSGSFKKEYISFFVRQGFEENKNYAICGFFYGETKDLIMICQIGCNRITIKCKKDCDNAIKNLEEIIDKL